ncbi:MAG: tetratricopeptide repeat protein, partial [Gemmatimonadaceae bacterium]|nr:tetratricopeptide repeat protein [Gemmatimonadaceae bacterium]
MANPNIAKLKKKATDFEQKKQFDRALSLYIQLLEEAGRDLDDSDLQLFNRVGDLLQRQGNVSEALAYYEKAVDVYAERGFLNNAIALCNKILRQSPARTAVYYKLGKISASKGFKSDAKKNFLEYADRMQKAGHVDEAFRALKEFADLCPDQDDIRLMLAEWLNKENRKSEAIEQLEVLYGKLESEGRQAEARATIDRIKAIDPNVTPRQSGQWHAQKSNDLVFLDLGANDPPAARRNAEPLPEAAPPAAPTPPAAARIPALEGLILTFDPEVEEAVPAAPIGIIGFEATASETLAADGDVDVGAITGFEAGGTPIDAIVDPSLDSLIVQPVESWTTSSEPVPHITGLETPRISLSGAHPVLSPLLDEPPLSGREFGALSLDPDVELAPAVDRPTHDFAIPSDLPLLDTDDASIDLLRIMRTPVGIPSIVEANVPGLTPSIDLEALPPLGGILVGGSHTSPPVTGSASPLDLDVPESLELSPAEGSLAASEHLVLAGDPVDGIPGGGGDDATPNGRGAEATIFAAAHDVPPVEDATAASDQSPADHTELTGDAASSHQRPDRDTSELIALDATARATDEILVVPSEVIDEETKRSLRLEFSLNGDETPDAWVEAALAAPDDLSLDRFLTPLGVPAIQEDATSSSS